MKQVFLDNDLNKFKDYFSIKENPWEWDKKYIEKTIKYIPYIKWIPWIKMVWIWNSISMNSWDKNSDIDLYIVTSEKRMWLVRILTTLIFQLLWVRKTWNKHAWRFCLSFFSTIDWMNFWNFAIEKDIYLYFWILYFKPLLSLDNTYDLFLEKNKSWLNLDNYQKKIQDNKTYIKYNWGSFWDNSKILNFIDKSIKNIFINKTINSNNKIGKPYWIIISKIMLKFHDWDIRKEISNKLSK